MSEHSAPSSGRSTLTYRTVDTRGRTLHGYAAVYGATADDLGGFRETIAPGAFAHVIDADVRCRLNHDPAGARPHRSGTLGLADEHAGSLRVRAARLAARRERQRGREARGHRRRELPIRRR